MKGKLSQNGLIAPLEELENSLREKKFDERDIRKHLLLVEEILMTYRDEFSDDTEFEVYLRRAFGLYSIQIKVFCGRYDYTEKGDSENLLDQLTKTMGLEAVWTYRRRCNNISIVLTKKKKIPQLVGIVIGMLIAYLTYGLCNVLPQGASELIETVLVDQLTPIVYAILRTIAGALIFFSISTAIGAMGDLDTFRRMIRTVLLRITANNILMICIFTVAFAMVFGIGKGGANFDINSFLDIVFDMIPSDLITPFIEGNMFQITVLAIVFGILIIALDNNVAPVKDLFECFRQFSVIAMQAFCTILPFVVFLNVFIVFSTLEGVSVGSAVIAIAVGIAATLVIMVIETVAVSINRNIGVADFVRKSMKGTMVGAMTASSSAALPDTKKDLLSMGIDETFIDLMLPIQQAFYKPFSILIVYTGVFSVSQVFNIELTGGELVALGITAFIIANACPPVPGGIISCLTILNAQMMFPEGTMGILILIATLMDYVGGGLSIYSIHAEIAGLACRMKKIAKKH